MAVLRRRPPRRSLYDVRRDRDSRSPQLILQAEAFVRWKVVGRSIDVHHKRIGHGEHPKLSMISAHVARSSNAST
jgi:hypothetical protein